LLGGTAGRTTLAGEGLQHEDGNSHLFAYAYPHLKAYDPCFAYELAVIIRDGMKRMYVDGEHLLYYITVMNEAYAMPPMPPGVEEGVLRGLYKVRATTAPEGPLKAHLLASGTILTEAIKAQRLLEDDFDVPTDVWSVTSFKELYRDAIDTERHNTLNVEAHQRFSYLERQLGCEQGVFVAATDYVKTLPSALGKWIPGRYLTLGTDGFGRSDSRQALRDYFEVDARHIAYGALRSLLWDQKLSTEAVVQAQKRLDIDPAKINPAHN
jgi:pyruvate dehydrogenase E1 component